MQYRSISPSRIPSPRRQSGQKLKNRPLGRVLIAQGRDAAHVPITHTFGPNTLVSFKVWTDEVSRPARCPCQNVFRAFVLLCRRLDLYGREWLGVNRTRIKAVNNKDRNFTRTWLQEFIRAADERLDDYLRRLDEGVSRKAEHAAATGRCWRNSSGPARARYR
jgi:hypothetical protein